MRCLVSFVVGGRFRGVNFEGCYSFVRSFITRRDFCVCNLVSLFY